MLANEMAGVKKILTCIVIASLFSCPIKSPMKKKQMEKIRNTKSKTVYNSTTRLSNLYIIIIYIII